MRIPRIPLPPTAPTVNCQNPSAPAVFPPLDGPEPAGWLLALFMAAPSSPHCCSRQRWMLAAGSPGRNWLASWLLLDAAGSPGCSWRWWLLAVALLAAPGSPPDSPPGCSWHCWLLAAGSPGCSWLFSWPLLAAAGSWLTQTMRSQTLINLCWKN